MSHYLDLENQVSKSTLKLQLKNQVDQVNNSVKRKSLIRYLTIIIDFSSSTNKQDFRPTRAQVIRSFISDFIKDYSDLNPLSKVSIIVTYKEGARLLSEFL